MQSFNHKMYVNIMRESAELAKQYRIDCWLEKKVEETPIIEAPKEVLDTVIPEELDIEVLRAEYKEKYWKSPHPATKVETLVEKLKQA